MTKRWNSKRRGMKRGWSRRKKKKKKGGRSVRFRSLKQLAAKGFHCLLIYKQHPVSNFIVF